MNIIATLLFSFSLFVSFGQYSISGGVNRRSEYLHKSQLKHFKSFNTTNYRFTHDYFNIKLDHRKRWLLMSGELTFLAKKNVNSDVSFTTYSGGGSDPSYSAENSYRANSNFAYLGLKINPNYMFEGQSIIFKKGKAGIIFGIFAQYEYLLSHTEHDHIFTYNSTSGYKETSFEEFDALTVRYAFISAGIRAARRLTFKYFFTEVNATFGISQNRTILAQYPAITIRPFFFETGLSMGYTFPENIGETETK